MLKHHEKGLDYNDKSRNIHAEGSISVLSSPCCDLATTFLRGEDKGLQKGFLSL